MMYDDVHTNSKSHYVLTQALPSGHLNFLTKKAALQLQQTFALLYIGGTDTLHAEIICGFIDSLCY